nr:hypothetical protein [uncultured Roseateles sp.]
MRTMDPQAGEDPCAQERIFVGGDDLQQLPIERGHMGHVVIQSRMHLQADPSGSNRLRIQHNAADRRHADRLHAFAHQIAPDGTHAATNAQVLQVAADFRV